MRLVCAEPISGILAALLSIREKEACHALLLLKVDEYAKGLVLLADKTAEDGEGIAVVTCAEELLIKGMEADGVALRLLPHRLRHGHHRPRRRRQGAGHHHRHLLAATATAAVRHGATTTAALAPKPNPATKRRIVIPGMKIIRIMESRLKVMFHLRLPAVVMY